MAVVLYVERKPVKNGWATRVPSLRIAAHGATQAEADERLKSAVRALLLPFQRNGTLEQEMRNLGLGPVSSDLEFTLQ